MEGTRCPSCGETRWQLTSFSLTRASICPVCDTEVLPERRMPGRSRTVAHAERRETDDFPVVTLDGAPPPPVAS